MTQVRCDFCDLEVCTAPEMTACPETLPIWADLIAVLKRALSTSDKFCLCRQQAQQAGAGA